MAIAGTHYYHPYSQPLPSPPMENNSRCTLPSISNLLDLADHGSPTTESAPAFSPRPEEWSSLPPRSNGPNTESRPESGYGKGPRGYPPSPPMNNETDQPSPVEKPMNHFAPKAAPSAYYHETTPPLETDRHHHHVQGYTRRPQPQPYQHHSNVSTPTSTASSYFSGSGASTPASTQPPHTPGLPHQRALPQSFPPIAVPVAVAPASGAISWQHHHYLQPAPGHFFPQSQDRYICPTCNKAFSRPSSLRIHSHSHTGEKPFKCSQAGCGKAFSVRSNMKRHERGCHTVQVPHGHMP